jgi:hypothetical protein
MAEMQLRECAGNQAHSENCMETGESDMSEITEQGECCSNQN